MSVDVLQLLEEALRETQSRLTAHNIEVLSRIGGVVQLLVDKGVFTKDEYLQEVTRAKAVMDQWAAEARDG